MQPLVLLNVVGLTPALLPHAPALSALASGGAMRAARGVFPAVTMTAQASMLTGLPPSDHGVVGNAWYWRDLGEVRPWLQNYGLIQGAGLETELRRRGVSVARLFWWFNQGSGAEFSVTPKPHYGADGKKILDISSTPEGLGRELESVLGRFPFQAFWGPVAGLASSRWIAEASARVMHRHRPGLTMVYLPHLDYDLQRFGPSGADLPRLVREVDDCAKIVLQAAEETGAKVLAVSEYGIRDVSRPIYVNRSLRESGLLSVREGPLGEMLDVFASRAFAVCDHQAAHVYVRDPADLNAARRALESLDGVTRVLDRERQTDLGIDHSRSGDLMLLSDPDAWFAYPWWLEDRRAPDFARTVDIHRKPGYDPCELFFDPKLRAPKLRMGLRLLQKKLGFRYRFDVTPLDASLVRGSHGLPAARPEEGPLLIAGRGIELPESPSLCDVKHIVLRAMGL